MSRDTTIEPAAPVIVLEPALNGGWSVFTRGRRDDFRGDFSEAAPLGSFSDDIDMLKFVEEYLGNIRAPEAGDPLTGPLTLEETQRMKDISASDLIEYVRNKATGKD